MGVGKKQQDAFLLLDAREVKKIALRNADERAIGIRRGDVIGIDHHQRGRRQQGAQAVAIFGEQGGGMGAWRMGEKRCRIR
jgi:hypothetical protein